MITSFHNVEAITVELDEDGEVIEIYADGLFETAVQVQQEHYVADREGIFAIIPRQPDVLLQFILNCWKRPCLPIHLPEGYNNMGKRTSWLEDFLDMTDEDEKLTVNFLDMTDEDRPLLSERNCSRDNLCENCFLYNLRSYEYPCNKCLGCRVNNNRPYFWEKSCDNCKHPGVNSVEVCRLCDIEDDDRTIIWQNWELNPDAIATHIDWLNENYINDIEE